MVIIQMSVTQNNTELVSNGVNISQSKLNTIDYKTTSMSYNHIDPSVPIKLKITDGKTQKILFESTYYLNEVIN